MGRDELIQQKEEVKAEITLLRRQLAVSQERGAASRAAEIESRLEALMAEEARLRLLIDRSR